MACKQAWEGPLTVRLSRTGGGQLGSELPACTEPIPQPFHPNEQKPATAGLFQPSTDVLLLSAVLVIGAVGALVFDD